jgi:hypothetical protein
MSLHNFFCIGVRLLFYFMNRIRTKFEPTAQKMKLDCNSLTRSFRLVLPRLLSYGLWSLSAILLHESRLSPERHYLCNNYTLFVTFGYL